MNEINKIQKYISQRGEVQCYPGITEDKVQAIFRNLSQYEQLDLLSSYKDSIVAIEHFEFDSHKNTRKGSNYKKSLSKIQKDFDEKLQSELAPVTIQTSQISDNGGLEQYFENFRTVFNQHVAKMPQYIERVKTEKNCDDVEMWFFAEDVTPLGNVYNSGDALRPLFPFSKANTDIFRSNQGIAGIMIGICIDSRYQLVIIPNTPANLDRLQSKFSNIKEERYIKFQPRVASFSIKMTDTL